MASFDALAGLPCTIGGHAGAISLAWDGASRALLTCVVPSGGDGGAAIVRVNEVMTGTASSAANEFVELINAGTAAADIGGWKLVYRSASGTSDTTLVTVPAGTTIPAGGFYLLGGSAYSGVADQSFATGLAGTGGAVGLRDATGTLLDSVGYGSATNALVEGSAAPAPAVGGSIGRHPDGHDTNDNASDFTAAATATPRATN